MGCVQPTYCVVNVGCLWIGSVPVEPTLATRSRAMSEIDDDGFVVAADKDAFEGLVGACVDFLVGGRKGGRR